MSYQIVSLDEKKRWQNYIKESLFYDFYHTWIYHSLEKNGTPKLFVFSKENIFIAIPIIVRSIQNSKYYDITSAYGYVGPISNSKFESLSDSFKTDFRKSFLLYLENENNISVFTRLHPFMNQDILLDQFKGLHSTGRTVVINLETSLEEQRSKYRRTLKENINQLRRKGYTIKHCEDLASIRDFISIYSENMQRIGASENYFFDENYFTQILASDEIDSKLLLVFSGDEAICGTLVTCTNNIIQGHLIGTRTDYLRESPAKLLVDEVTVLGRKYGMKYYHLGGGVGGNDDSLFNWKAGFSDCFLDFKTWRYISNQNIYNELVETLEIEPEVGNDYFPLYRFEEVKN